MKKKRRRTGRCGWLRTSDDPKMGPGTVGSPERTCFPKLLFGLNARCALRLKTKRARLDPDDPILEGDSDLED